MRETLGIQRAGEDPFDFVARDTGILFAELNANA
jgi:hypothetical protein